MGIFKSILNFVQALSKGEVETSTDRASTIEPSGGDETRVRDKPYNPLEHKSFYVISADVLRAFLDDPTPKSAKELRELTSRAESSIRQFCIMLHKDGILKRVSDESDAAVYELANVELARQKCQEFESALQFRVN